MRCEAHHHQGQVLVTQIRAAGFKSTTCRGKRGGKRERAEDANIELWLPVGHDYEGDGQRATPRALLK